MADRGTVFVTGPTGYIGGRLVPRLLQAGYRVRCLARDPSRLQGRSWMNNVEIVQGDVFSPTELARALTGIQYAYYLIHSLASGARFHELDERAATNFGQVSAAAGVGRIIYLGGLGDPQADLSEHLRSRQLTGQALRRGGVPVTEFQAAVIVGSGSLSFEMIRYLTERLPVMICPRWVYTRIQPIGVDDCLDYLVAALDAPTSAGQIVEIGGSQVLTYGEMMTGYAAERGLRRWLLPVPVLTPRLSSYWLHLVTPLPATIARPIIEGLRNEVIVRDDRARRLFPDIAPSEYRTAVRDALRELESGSVETSWSDALVSSLGDAPAARLTTKEGKIAEQRQQTLSADSVSVFRAFTSLGGETGWLHMNWAWRLRGWTDRLLGGVGMRRGRRDPMELRVGDALDFWRVEAIVPGVLLRLRAEMKLPGSAWLEFQASTQPGSTTRLIQTAIFAPKGLSGLAYWYLLYPIHSLIFSGLIRALARRAIRLDNAPSPS